MTRIQGKTSVFIVFLMMAVAAIALSALPTALDVDKNQQSEFCLFVDGRELRDERTGDCAPDYGAIAGRFFLYFAVFGGALLGPFGLYLVLLALKTVLTSSRSRRDRSQGDGPPR